MLESVVTFQDFARSSEAREIIKYCVEAMERGVLHVDAVNVYGDTFGSVCVFCDCRHKYWLRYWALKPSVVKFWTSFAASYDDRDVRLQKAVVLDKIAVVFALWEDLCFVYNLGGKKKIPWLRQEVERRVSASLRFAWLASVVGVQ